MKNDVKENKSSEAAYPVYDLSEAVKVAEAVRDLGGNNAPVSRSLLAQHLKYAETGPSFFQRVAASRSFGVIDGRGSYSLTDLGKQYFYPTVENGKEAAAVKMLAFPKSFSLLVQKFDGGKLPSNEMIGNIIHAEADIPVSKKGILAGCFVRSAQFIGAIDSGGFLRCKALVSAGKKVLDGIDSGRIPKEFNLDDAPADLNPKPKADDQDQNDAESQIQTLYLDNSRKRKVTIKAPFTVSKEELERIRAWFGIVLIVQEINSKNESQ